MNKHILEINRKRKELNELISECEKDPTPFDSDIIEGMQGNIGDRMETWAWEELSNMPRKDEIKRIIELKHQHIELKLHEIVDVLTEISDLRAELERENG